jgi:alginate O-acetyltransferase complex protein AlgI
MFPQLIAGPIVRYADIERQLRERCLQWTSLLEGIQRFLIGLGKKILISNALGELCAIFRESDEKSVVFFWVYAISYTLQIYFDFSGYSDMAIGLGKMFGFDFLENFQYPYISKSITEFWRRWHMSLGSWFRDYVYIPLGGNRVSKGRWYLNIFIVWCLTGLWHGGSLQFVVWGLMFAVLLVFEKQWFLKKLEKGHLWNHFYVLLVVIFSFVIFGATDMKEAMVYMKGMLGLGKVPLISRECIYYLKSYGVLIVAAIFGSTPVLKQMVCKLEQKENGKRIIWWLRPMFLLLLLVICTAYLVDSSFNPFLYFRF